MRKSASVRGGASLRLLLAALFLTRTHPPGEISLAVQKLFRQPEQIARAREDRHLVIGLGLVVVISAPWLFGWPQIMLGAVATALVVALMPR